LSTVLITAVTDRSWPIGVLRGPHISARSELNVFPKAAVQPIGIARSNPSKIQQTFGVNSLKVDLRAKLHAEPQVVR